MSLENMSQQEVVALYKEKFGIEFPEYLNYKAIVADNDISYKKMAMDVDTYTFNPSSNGVPAWFTTVNLNKIIDQLLITRKYTEIGEPLQYGNFESTTAQFGVVGLSGQVEPYADYSASQMSDINVTWPTRDVFRGQTNIQYGELEVATMSSAKIDAVSKKQYAAAMNVAIAQNKMFFYGNLNSSSAFINRIFGLLNDPSLNAATPATNGGGSSPLWATKAGTASGAQDIANDVIVTAYSVLQSQMGGNVSLDDEFMLCCSTTASSYLNASNIYGLNAAKIIKDTMPNVKFVFAPEYKTIGSFQLIATKSLGENLVKDLFTYKMRGHALVPTSSTSYAQKWSFGTSGCALLQYAPVATISGIETP